MDIQFAAKVYCNKAEKINYLIWSLCIIAAVLSIVVKYENNFYLLFCIIIEITAFFLQLLMDYYTSLFSTFRNSFDRYVLFDKDYFFSNKEVSHLTSVKKRKDYFSQINNNGNLKPPGVKDWYELNGNYEYSEIDAIIECQKQNKYWTTELMRIKFLITNVIFIIFLILFIFIAKMNSIKVITLLFSTIALILKILERGITNLKYLNEIPILDGIIESACLNGNYEQVNLIQTHIDNLRKMPIYGMNIIHKISASKTSEKYRNIQQLKKPLK